MGIPSSSPNARHEAIFLGSPYMKTSLHGSAYLSGFVDASQRHSAPKKGYGSKVAASH